MPWPVVDETFGTVSTRLLMLRPPARGNSTTARPSIVVAIVGDTRLSGRMVSLSRHRDLGRRPGGLQHDIDGVALAVRTATLLALTRVKPAGSTTTSCTRIERLDAEEPQRVGLGCARGVRCGVRRADGCAGDQTAGGITHGPDNSTAGSFGPHATPAVARTAVASHEVIVIFRIG